MFKISLEDNSELNNLMLCIDHNHKKIFSYQICVIPNVAFDSNI